VRGGVNKVIVPSLLEAYIWTRFGYGRYDADLWFIGIEEGGGGLTEFETGVNVWNNRGRPEIDDVRSYHEQSGMSGFFSDPPVFQKTWDGLIRVSMSSQGLNCSRRSVQEYQMERFAQSKGFEAALELYPLPAKSVKAWVYAEYASQPGLKFLDRKSTYRRSVGDKRGESLRERLMRFNPKVVVFYGVTYRKQFEMIAGGSFEQTLIDNVFILQSAATLSVLVLHPADFRSSQNYFSRIGDLIRSHQARTRTVNARNQVT
jgi:hypothetical protein